MELVIIPGFDCLILFYETDVMVAGTPEKTVPEIQTEASVIGRMYL